MCRTLGVVVPSANDWEMGSVVPIFSACAIGLGVTTFTLGKWAERVGPRKVAGTAAVLWSSGLACAALGTYTHTLPLCYAGYGALGGAGWGLGYISPVSNLMKWFPDKRGLATGLALASFGGGAILAAPGYNHVCSRGDGGETLVHAEAHAIAQATRESPGRALSTRQGVRLWVVELDDDTGGYGDATPCAKCREALNQHFVQSVRYSTPEGPRSVDDRPDD